MSNLRYPIPPGYCTLTDAAKLLEISRDALRYRITHGLCQSEVVPVSVELISMKEIERLRGVQFTRGVPGASEPSPDEDFGKWLEWKEKEEGKAKRARKAKFKEQT